MKTDQTIVQIPDEVKKIIAGVQDRFEKERIEKEERELAERVELIKAGRSLLDAYFIEALKQVPEWIRSYHLDSVSDDELCNFAGWGKDGFSTPIIFSIPGLSKIAFSSKDNRWRHAVASWGLGTSDGPELNFGSRSFWYPDLESVLGKSEKEFVQHEEDLEIYTLQITEQNRRYRNNEECERLSEERYLEEAKAEKQKEIDETEKLLDALRKDPVAIALIKAFLSVNQERRIFREQADEADDALYSMEERLSRRVADLRKQADDAERNAKEERQRVYDLEGDLADAEKKSKQCIQGW